MALVVLGAYPLLKNMEITSCVSYAFGGFRPVAVDRAERFLGKGRLLFNLEYRLKLIDFDLRKLWDVSIDGVAFGDAGRVYTSSSDFRDHPFDDMRFSYGGGTRIGFSSGLVARIDVGFSEEEQGLVYLTFGHTF